MPSDYYKIVKARLVRRPSRASQMGCCMFLYMYVDRFQGNMDPFLL